MTVFQGFSQINCMSAKWIFKPNPRHIVSVIVCVMMLAAAGVASAATYWVAPNGSDSNAGTQSEPWQTFAHAAATAIAGDTVVFQDGIYSNNGIVSPNSVVVLNNSGTANAPITFMAQHRGKAILDGGAGESGWTETNGTWSCPGAENYLSFTTAQYVVIQGFTIQNTCYNAIQDNDAAQNITLRWNDISNAGVNLPAVTPPAPGTASNTVGGFYCGTKATGVILDGNSVHDVDPEPSIGGFGDHGFYINCPNVTITNNIFYNIDNGYDIQVAGSESGDTGAQNVLIANNTFGPLDPNNLNPHHNYLTGEVVVWRGSPNGSVSGVTVQNNIFYDPQDYAIYGSYPTVSNCQISANLISNTAEAYYAVGTLGSGCTVGTNLVNTNPGMVDPAHDNFYLLPWSQAIDAGVTLGYVTTDFARTCRPQGSAYDIGAYEHVDFESYNRCRGLGFNFPMSHRATN